MLPDAEYKFYLTASVETRAKRRYDELTARGEDVSFERVKADIEERDERDMTRAIAPLKKAEDAIEINSDDMTAEQVAERMLGYIVK